MKIRDKIDFTGGNIIRDKFIDLDIPICSQEMELTEDMFQIEFGDYVLDLGWTPEIDCNGNFKVFLIKNKDWEKPVKFFEPKTINELILVVNECLKIIR